MSLIAARNAGLLRSSIRPSLHFPIARCARTGHCVPGRSSKVHQTWYALPYARASFSSSSAQGEHKSAERQSDLNIPNLLTGGRLVAIPGIVIAWYGGFPGAAACLFATAAITDFFDGYLARRWNQTTPLGALLDPLADKLLVSSSLLILVEHAASPLVTVPAVAILGRELAVSSLREWMQAHRPTASQEVSVAWHGKAKAALQLVALQVMLAGLALESEDSSDLKESKSSSEGSMVYDAGLVLLWLAAGMTVASGAQYARVALRSI
eukprot:TRINITY_DN49915_c0_g1_i1.p1 TRINITY_DN49915_c0_g1~~TRINITY_DN49915_c0_g1_i1.p1  ORF type:complete len:267 (+),score=39.98 TRINITY_DN49915_c0_g1_i1:25-825(+)